MKELHPAGVTINMNGEHVHYLLRLPGGDMTKMNKPTDKPLMVVDRTTFNQLVKENRVQLFMDNGDGPTNIHTEEEMHEFRKSIKAIGGITDDETYWKSEATFYDNVITIPGAINITLVAAHVMKLFNQVLLTGAVYSKDMYPELQTYLKKNCTTTSLTSPDMMMCNWLQSQFTQMLSDWESAPITVCMDTMKHLDNTVYAAKMLGFRNVTEGELSRVVDQLNWAIPPMPPAVTEAAVTTSATVASDKDEGYDSYSQYRRFFQEHKDKVALYIPTTAVDGQYTVGVVTCAPTDFHSSGPSLSSLTGVLSQTGWEVATYPDLCDSPERGIMIVKDWLPSRSRVMAEIARRAPDCRIMSIHLFDWKTGKLVEVIDFLIDGGVRIESECLGSSKSTGVHNMSLT